jgi:hypothetical protein
MSDTGMDNNSLLKLRHGIEWSSAFSGRRAHKSSGVRIAYYGG